MDAPPTTKLFTLNDGNQVPSVGLGTSRIKVHEMSNIIMTAIENGYRHFDSAQNYKNTVELGEALRKVLTSRKAKRENLFITTKETMYYNRPEDVKSSLDECLHNLQLDYVDLFLIHHPAGFKREAKEYIQHGFEEEQTIQQTFEIADHLKIWTEMEKLVDAGLAKSIGVSNFNKEQLSVIISNSRIKPAVLQTECHAYLQEPELLQYCRENMILLTAFAPLGSPGLAVAGISGCDIVQDNTVTKMSSRYNKSPAQILLRHHIQRGIAVIPKSSNVVRIKANINIFYFDLLPEDMKELSKLDRGHRIFNEISFVRNHPQNPYPVKSDATCDI